MTTEPDPGEMTELGCLLASGTDAAEFLQAQLSADLAELHAGQLALAGWHNPQGRLRSLCWAGPLENGNWRLVTDANQLDPLATGLSRYVLRAKVSFSPEPDSSVGIAENDGTQAANISQWSLPGTDRQSLVAGPVLPAGALAPLAARAALISAGVPRLDATLSDQFLGQSLNLDILAGISFAKGCFPGQEVLARLHNLGQVKRRLLRFGFEGALPAIGARVVNPSGEHRGQVICRSEAGELLASVELRALPQALLIEGSEAPLSQLPLPYPIPELTDT